AQVLIVRPHHFDPTRLSSRNVVAAVVALPVPISSRHGRARTGSRLRALPVQERNLFRFCYSTGQRAIRVQCVCHIAQATAHAGFFSEISATLELARGPRLLPLTDTLAPDSAGCGFNSMMPKEKALVASYRHFLSVSDGVTNLVA